MLFILSTGYDGLSVKPITYPVIILLPFPKGTLTAKEVRRHMEYENQAVFTYVEQLLQGNLSDEYNIATFASKHNQIDTKLKELKNIIIKYYPEKENNNLLNAVLFDIFNCEQDLASHCQVEDYMFVPAVAQIEKRLKDEQ